MFESVLQSLDRFFVMPRQIYGNSLEQIAVALGILLAVLLAYWLLRLLVVHRARAVAARWSDDWALAIDQLAGAARWFLVFLVAVYVASLVLLLHPRTVTVLQSMAAIALLVQGAIWGTVLVTFGVNHYARRRLEQDAATYTTVTAIGLLGKIVLWSLVSLLILANLGVNVTALVAGLGVGGIAVALAAQNILGDLFASLSIVLDKPFVLGDFISVGSEMGSVESIGLKTTRLRSLSGEQLVFSNNDLLQSRIRNYKRMYERRVVFGVGVTYDTPRSKLVEIPRRLQQFIESSKQTRFDRAHFKEFGPSALIFEAVYFVRSPDFTLYMNIQQDINLALHEYFESEGIEFAYPTQTLFLHSATAGVSPETTDRPTA